MVLSAKQRKGTQKTYFWKSQFVVINIHLKADHPQDLGEKEGFFCLDICVHLEQNDLEQGSSFSLPLN